MKELMVTLLIALSTITCAQVSPLSVFPLKDNRIHYTEIIKVDSTLTADQLYQRAKRWAVSNFVSAQAVIQNDSPEAHTLIIKSCFPKGHNSMVSDPRIWFVLNIENKDGRYRYHVYDLRYTFSIQLSGSSSNTDTPLEGWLTAPIKTKNEIKRQSINESLLAFGSDIDARIKEVINSLNQSMTMDDESW